MRHTIVAWMEDKPGVLSRVAGLFRRRNFNIESLTVGHSETPGISRMTLWLMETTGRLISADAALQTDQCDRHQGREPRANRGARTCSHQGTCHRRHSIEIIQLVNIYRASIVDVDIDSLMIQITGSRNASTRWSSCCRTLAYWRWCALARSPWCVVPALPQSNSTTACPEIKHVVGRQFSPVLTQVHKEICYGENLL